MLEIEVKLRVGSVADVESRLKVLGAFQESPRTLEDDHLFDFADGRLTDAGSLLRVRHRSDGGFVTFKGKVVSDLNVKVREEQETGVSDLPATIAILEALGLRPIWRYQKYRTSYRLGRLHAVVDESPVGNFMELEGSKEEIDRWAGALGYSPRDYLTGTYRDLYEARCREQGEKPGNMVFPQADA